MVGVAYENSREWLRRFQWGRGLRAALAVGSALLVCHLLHKPLAAGALGAFNPLLVDNGGPYKTRLTTMSIALLGGSFAFILGSIVPSALIVVILVTMLVCFATTFARVLSQPVASASVLIIVSYFAGLGGVRHTLPAALQAVELLLLGGLWAILLSLVFWPLDPFRPARLAVSTCYSSLAELTEALAVHVDDTDQERAAHLAHEGRRRHRVQVEAAHAALASTSARAPSRTSRARNLTVLLETSDMLLARNIRLTELAELPSGAAKAEAHARIKAIAIWLAATERVIEEALLHKPYDEGASFAPDGSQRLQFITRHRPAFANRNTTLPDPLLEHLLAEERDALLEVEIAFDAVRGIWTGSQAPQSLIEQSESAKSLKRTLGWSPSWLHFGWTEAVHANWTLNSVMLRHALRLMVVGAVNVVVMRLIHVNHGFWLPMTSIILMQPYSAGTARKSVQRVTGSVAGGIFAAVLAAIVPDVPVMIVVLTLLSALTLATFAVDYAIYCFFLTPTFVLLSLPYPHDWHYAGIRIGTTLAGALIAVTAMRLLWPERAEVELGRLLRRGAGADAAYIRAMLRFWESAPANRRAGERDILAPARRACGLASNDVEEAVDRIMQEPHFRIRISKFGEPVISTEEALTEQALTFATYLRRLTQSVTTLAFVGQNTPVPHERLEHLAMRLDRISGEPSPAPISQHQFGTVASGLEANIADEQIGRIDRQTVVLERVSAALAPISHSPETTR